MHLSSYFPNSFLMQSLALDTYKAVYICSGYTELLFVDKLHDYEFWFVHCLVCGAVD